MREIKFRGKCVDTGEWVYGNYFIDLVDIEDGIIWREQPTIQQRYGDHFKYHHVHSSTVGQYTGLLDKNGKEIFEGDVVTSNEYPFQDDGEYNYHGIIEWSEELTSYYLVLKIANPSKRGISDGIGEALQDYNACELEIIGNIYEGVIENE